MSEVTVRLRKPYDAQAKVLSQAKRFNVLCCGRRWGKSALAVNLLSELAIESHPVGYFTPTYKLLEGTFAECLNALHPIVSRKHENQKIELITGGVIDFWSLDNPYAGRSRKYKRVIGDEIAFAKNFWEQWTESMRPTLTDLKGDAWFLSTPKGKNDFYKLFMRGKSGEENWQSWQMSTYTNPYIDPLELDDAKRDLPEMAFNQEYLALFSDNIANPFGLDHISRCIYPLSSQPSVCFGIDLAKKNDWTVIVGLDKFGQISHFQRFQKDWKQTMETIIELPPGLLTIDSTGAGDPVVEEIQRIRTTEAFWFTSRTKQQLMEGLAHAIQNRRVTVLDGVMKDELDSFEYEYSRTGVKYSAPSGMHDDCVCALALALKNHNGAAQSGEISVW